MLTRLEFVIAQDNQTLTNLGITHEQIANALEKLLETVFEERKALPSIEWIERETNFPNLYKPDTIPIFSKNNLLELFTVCWKNPDNLMLVDFIPALP